MGALAAVLAGQTRFLQGVADEAANPTHHSSTGFRLYHRPRGGCPRLRSGCLCSSTPESSPELAVASAPLSFAQVSSGTFHSCGVTTDGRAYCWGGNDKGQLGDGTTFINTARTTPSAVIGGLRFRHVSVGYEHSCGVTLDDRVFCWGLNFSGQLGNGTQGSDHFSGATPAEVVGGRRFRQVRAGYSHTCAITRANVAYCWGDNLYGQLGDGTTTGDGPFNSRATPVRVLGGLHGPASGGGVHTCGVTQTDQVYCWGLNENGQLGVGNTVNRTRPVPVSGGRQFRQVEAEATIPAQ